MGFKTQLSPSWIELSRSALVGNLKILKKNYGNCGFALKANAYGHGLAEVFETLREHLKGAWLFTAYLEEAQLLRQMGHIGPILQVTPIRPDLLPEAAKLGVDILLSSDEQVVAWTSAKKNAQKHI